VADVPAPDLVRLAPGDAAQVHFDALPGLTLPGRVSAVAPALDRATGLGVVRVALALGSGPAPPVGVFGSARVQTGAERSALLVPAGAVRATAGAAAELVGCGPDGVAHVRQVQRGETRDGLAEIASGVQAGERVVLDPVLGVSEGDRIKVVP
jgi:hypothetical protein